MKLTFGKGLNADALPSELGDGFVSDCLGFRFRSGFAEVVGGTSATIMEFTGSSGSLFQLYTSTNTYVVCSTTSRTGAYTVGGAASADDITRLAEGAVISSATAAGTTVTITTATNHGLTTGNTVYVWGFTPSTYNAEAVAITRISNTVFTYTVASAPAVSPATAIGMYSTTSLSHSRFTSGGELNGVLLLNSTADGCYYWGGNTSIPARKIVGSYTARIGVPFKNYVVQLAPTISSVEYPFRICWSTAAEPGSVPHNGFTAAATNEAGDVDKPEIGEMVTALPLGDDLIVYGTKGRLVMRYVGGNDVFAFTVLPGSEGCYDLDTVVDTPAGHVFVDRDRHIRVHTGGGTNDISDGRVQKLLGGSDTSVAWVVHHARQNEVWIGYTSPPTPAGFATRFVLIWNYKEDTWGRSTASNHPSAISVRTSSTSTNLALYANTGGASTSSLQELDTQGTTQTTAYIERIGIDAGDNDVVKNLQRSRWNIESNSGYTPVYTVSHGSAMFASTSPTYATGVTYTPGTTDYCNARATGGKYLAVKLSVATSSGFSPYPYYALRVRTADIDFTAGGRR